MIKCGEAKTEEQQRTKKSSLFEMTNCGQENRSATMHQKIQAFSNDKLWRSETEVQQCIKISSHFQMTNCGKAKNEVQQRTKKSSHFQMINCGEAKPKCSNAPKNLVIFK